MQPYGIHIAIYGDAGRGNQEQFDLGRAMAARHALRPFQLALSTGDNQYDSSRPGLMEQIFEKPFAALIAAGVPFYQTVGNHDMDEERILAQLEYSRKVDALRQGRGGWVMPAEHYVIREAKGNVRIIVLNVTAPESDFPQQTAALEFARRELSAATSEWTIVCFHYHLWSTGLRGDHEEMLETYLPLLEEFGVDLVLAGHEHHAEFFAPREGLHFALVGHGSEIRRQKVRSAQPCLFRTNEIGFAELSLEPGLAQFGFVDRHGREIWRTKIVKGHASRGLESPRAAEALLPVAEG